MDGEPYGYTIFCDDIREEVGGKLSYMGVYHSVIYLHGPFPFTLPKFCFAITYMEPIELRSEKIKVVVQAPGSTEPLLSLDADLSKMRGNADKVIDPLLKEGADRLTFRANLIGEQIRLTEAGAIKVRAIVGEMEIKLGALRVLTHPSVGAKSD